MSSLMSTDAAHKVGRERDGLCRGGGSVIALLRQRSRVTYRTLQIQFTLDDEQLAALKDELLGLDHGVGHPGSRCPR